MPEPIIEIKDYSLNFKTFDGTYHALSDVNLSVRPGETLGIVGESALLPARCLGIGKTI